jgi:hypothetical protein
MAAHLFLPLFSPSFIPPGPLLGEKNKAGCNLAASIDPLGLEIFLFPADRLASVLPPTYTKNACL